MFWKKLTRFLFLGGALLMLVYASQTSLFQSQKIDEVEAVAQGCPDNPASYPQCGSDIAAGACTGAPFDAKNTVMVTPAYVGEEGNCTLVYSCQDLGPKEGQCGNSTQDCTEKKETYGQCGGTVGLEDKDKTHQYEITRYTNPCTNAVRYDPPKDAGPAAACGAQNCTENTRDYPQCGGTVGLEDKDKTHTYIIREFTNTCTQAKRYQIVEDKGNLGQCQTTTPPQQVVCNDGEVSLSASPATVKAGEQIRFTISGDASTYIGDNFSGGVTNCSGPWNSKTCTATGEGNFTWNHTWKRCVGDVNNCSSQCSKSASFTVTKVTTPPCTSNGSCSAPTPACGTVTTGVDNCGNPCSKQGSACVPGGGPITVSPVITNTNTNTNTQTVNVTQSGNVGVAQPAVTQLPKTGLPALAWSALAFLPAGFSMKKFKKLRKTLEDDANFIWEDRQFKGRV